MDSTIVNKIFKSFKQYTNSKHLKNLLNSSIKRDINVTCDFSEKETISPIEKECTEFPGKELMLLTFRALIEISALPQSKDFKSSSCKFYIFL